MKYFFGVVLLSLVSSFYVAAKMPKLKETGLPLNQIIPELKVTDINGQATKLNQISGDKGSVLVFFRSADWCPYCKKHLIEINQWQEKFSKLGYGIAGISYDSQQVLKKFGDEHQIKFPLLADHNHQTITSFNILNQDYQPEDKNYGIPYPGIMIVDAKGKLLYKYFYQSYRNRVDMEKLFNALLEENKKGVM